MERCEIHELESTAVLDELCRANRIFGIHRRINLALRPWLEQARVAGRPLCVLDAGCGTGGQLLYLAASLRHSGVPCRLLGLDLNPWAIERAATRACSAGYPKIEWRTGRLAALPAACVDVAVSSFVLHHLDALSLLDWMAQLRRIARQGAVQVDFRRPARKAATWAWQASLAALGFSAALREDGRISLARAWRHEDLGHAARAAGWEPRHENFGGLCTQWTGRWTTMAQLPTTLAGQTTGVLRQPGNATAGVK